MNPVALSCVAVLTLQVALLGFWVSIVRSRSQAIFYGSAMDPTSTLAKAVRAHGNAAEYAGLLALGALLLSGLWL